MRWPNLSGGEWFDLGRVIFWVCLVYPAWRLGWLGIVGFVSVLSLWALVESAWAAFRANNEKALKRIEEQLKRIEEQIEKLSA